VENTLLIGLSKQVALRRELDVVSNNIANLNTTGFKADMSVFEEYLMPVARANDFTGRDTRLSYVQDRATWHDLRQGPVQMTSNPLDVAVDGDAFLTVQTPRGERYTRNGALQINAAGQLVTGEGFQVLGANGPIVFQRDDNGISISADGTISVREGINANVDAVRGRLRLASFAQPQLLTKDGSSIFAPPAGVVPQPAPEGTRVMQGALEKSNVRAVVEMTRMIEVTRAYTQIATLMQQQGDLRRTAIERLAEVPA
jgi:flagellar basal-body rod protein FlgF/flagellar basal-body rod protein FlgG